MRQHVNPLSSFFQLPLRLPSTNELFENPKLPIHLDIGSSRGKFLIEMASLHKDWNFLGVEIRRSLVLSAESERNQMGLNNLHFLFCNANVSLPTWLTTLRVNELRRVSIQFPDPWFKKRHFKRKLLQPALLLALAGALEEGAELFIQSDLEIVIEPMQLLIELSQCFDALVFGSSSAIDKNPFHIPTEREKYVLEKALPVFRSMYLRNGNPLPKLQFLEKRYGELMM